ncbi:HpcH/HpaI aldolase family protein [Actibacterium lipolyticum]|uniref:Hydroxypyruvate/pyruvate aldolase n=1 Tax=Actibacterium lipolyticum TaxID=1524263 RepID=A0A238JVV8_9RHOB|nr:HpcH/HpaI aldolase/citrate lyase family protein [Actibacterium lipolyticum]SMX34780.1 4-hydroxy-2-oxovalerate aldolase [Actibacterium lipolyticum]
MPAPRNDLKKALADGKMQIGVWLAMGSAVSAEIAGSAGFDWCLVDGEHAPYDLALIRTQLQALAGHDTSAVVRVPVGEEWVIKQVLDIGAQTIVVPMVDTGEQARAVVRAAQYPPKGTRGVGASLARASGFSAIKDYPKTADEQICVIVQAESQQALGNLKDICAVDGVDAVFIGPADLSADMGFPGEPGHPQVKAAIKDAIGRLRASGKAVGVITFSPDEFAYYADLGVTFLGVGGDVTSLGNALRGLASVARDAVS